MNKRELGINYFKQGYNCAQSVALAFKDELGLDENTVLMLSSAFGGGFGRMREVCGAISGMTMVVGAKCGYVSPTDNVAKMNTYAVEQELAKQFIAKNGSIVCAQIIKTDDATSTSPTPSERTSEYYKKRPCAEYVGDACEILEKYLTEKGLM